METLSILKPPRFPKKKYAVLAENVCKSYADKVPVLNNFSMHVEEGIVYGLLGSSGCGKTSALSCIVGLRKSDSGCINVLGEDVNNGFTAKENIGFMPQDVALYDQLTVSEMLKYYSKLYHMSRDKFNEQMTLLENLLDLPGYGSRRVTTLSGGQQRRVSFAITLLHSPKLLILDEPTVGLDPLLRESIWKYLFNLASTHKTTIIITTHYIEEVRNSNMVGIMRKGMLLVEEDPAVLMQTHNTTLLEDVVLEICRTHRQKRRMSFQLYGEDLTSAKVSAENAQCVTFSKYEKKFSRLGVQEKSLAATINESIEKTLAYSQVVWTNFLRHPIFIFLVLFLPPFQLFSTGIVVGVEPKYTPLGIINHEIPNWQTNCSLRVNETCNLATLSCDLIKQFTSGIFISPIEFQNTDDAHAAVTRGDIRGYMVIPHNYSTHIVERALAGLYPEIENINGSSVTLHLDMSDFVTVYVLMTELYQCFERFVKDIGMSCEFDFTRIDIPFFYREPVYGEMDGTTRDYMLPALISGILFEVAFAVAPLILLNDMNLGTLERSQVAGLKFIELVFGLFLAMASLTVLQALICWVSLQYGLGFNVMGSIFTFTFLCLVTAFCSGAFGLVIGIWSKDAVFLVITCILIVPVLMIYVGIFLPVEVIPHPFRDMIYYLFPTASTVPSFRFVMNRGVSISHPQVWPGVLITIGWGLVFALLCPVLLRYNKSKL